MKVRLIAAVIPCVASGAMLTMSSDVRAASHSYSCSSNTDGGGSCSGSFAVIRSSPRDYAVFTEASWTSNTLLLSFGSSDGGAPHGCIAFSDQVPALAALWPILMQEKGTFFVEWDKTGACTNASATDSIHF